jgi:hypothetical protein
MRKGVLFLGSEDRSVLSDKPWGVQEKNEHC